MGFFNHSSLCALNSVAKGMFLSGGKIMDFRSRSRRSSPRLCVRLCSWSHPPQIPEALT